MCLYPVSHINEERHQFLASIVLASMYIILPHIV
jgi:hypothetical protein